ncbi:MAG: TRAP transporter substrate-binding protein [Rikenellaceae bacterium]
MRLKNFAIALAVLALLTSCDESHDVRVLKMSHNLNQQHPVHVGLLHLNEKLQEVSGGKMEVEIYSGAQLGSENQCIEMLQIGSLALTKVSAASLSNFVDEFKLFGLPYIFESKEQFYDIIDGPIGDEMLLSTEKCLFRGLGYFDAGARSFYTTDKPILKPEDLKGLRIRVMPNAMAIDMMSAFGGSATPISLGELYTALQSGVVDGAENNSPTYHTSNDFEVAKHYSINEHAIIPDVLIISNVIWADLSTQEREWLMEAIESAEMYQREVWARQEKESMAEVEKRGCTIYYPDKQPFIDMVRDLPEKYKETKDLYRMVEKVQEFKSQLKEEEAKQ